VHFSWRLHDRVFHGEKSSYEVFYRLIQELYETRLKGEDKDKRDVYNEMASIMGRNLKELLR